MAKKFEAGAKVLATIKGQKVPAVVRASQSMHHNYDMVQLRIAQQNPFTGEWLVSDMKEPVQSYKLKERYSHIPQLDEEEEDVYSIHSKPII